MAGAALAGVFFGVAFGDALTVERAGDAPRRDFGDRDGPPRGGFDRRDDRGPPQRGGDDDRWSRDPRGGPRDDRGPPPRDDRFGDRGGKGKGKGDDGPPRGGFSDRNRDGGDRRGGDGGGGGSWRR